MGVMRPDTDLDNNLIATEQTLVAAHQTYRIRLQVRSVPFQGT